MFSRRAKVLLPTFVLILAAALGVFFLSPHVQAAVTGQASLAEGSETSGPIPTVAVIGQGSVFMEPDVAHTIVGVHVTDTDIQAANKKAQKTINAVKKALMAQGVKAKDIQTVDYSIHMQRPEDFPPMLRMGEEGPSPQKETQYVVNTALSVKIRDMKKVAKVIAAAIEAGANDIYGISFSAEDPDKVRAQALKLAVEDARTQAEELAALHGMALGEVVSISETFGDGMPMPIMEKVVYGGGGGGFSPGQLEVSTQIQVVYTLRPLGEAPFPTSAPTPSSEAPAPADEEKDAQAEPPASGAIVKEVTAVTVPVGMEPASGDKAHPLIIEGDDPELLRQFVSLWFATESTPFMPQETNPRLYLGDLPEDIPLPATVFDGFDVVGVLEENDGMMETILLKAEEDAKDALDTLNERLLNLGLEPPPGGPALMGGFGFEVMDMPSFYCNKKDGSWIMVTANALDEGAVVRVDVEHPDEMMMGGSPCDMPHEEAFPPEMQLLPPLKPPADTRVMTDSAGGGPNSFYQSAIVRTSLSLSDLDSHYQEQLQKAGWELVGSDRTKAVAWSEWQLQDKQGRPWVGSLLITKRFAQDDSYLMLLRVERAPR